MRTQILKLFLLVGIVLAVLGGGYAVVRVLPDILPLPQKSNIPSESVVQDQGSGLPLSLPSGFSISTFATELPGVRDLERDPAGNLIVSIPEDGSVVALPDTDEDGVADHVVEVIKGLNHPHGLATYCESDDMGLEEICFLYIAETDAVARYKYDATTLQAFDREVLFELPTAGGGHTTRSLHFSRGANGGPLLLTSVGSSCNVCVENDSWRAAVISSTPEGDNPTVFARGLRNAVFMTSHPQTGEVWATENGRDLLGDDTPPDEINILRNNVHYGWPFCYGNRITDNQVTTGNRIVCSETARPHILIQAHSAPLGLAFVPQGNWAREFTHNLLVAYHGSWNRSEPTGYKVERFVLGEDGSVQSHEPFIEGWLTSGGDVLGRPVDILAEENAIYISDDQAGKIYRVTH